MKKIFTKKPSLYFLTIGSIILIMIVFAIVVQFIGYFAFTSSYQKEYNSSVLRIARLCRDTISPLDLGVYKGVTPEELDTLAGFEYYTDYVDYCEENGLEVNDKLYIESAVYSGYKDFLSSVCNTMDMSVIYAIIPDKDYKNYTCIFNCVNDDSGYEPWPLGYRVETPEDYYEAYQNIYENGSEEEIIARYNNLGEGKPHITSLVPIHDEEGNVSGILCVQRYADELSITTSNFRQGVGALAVILIIIIVGFESRLLRTAIIQPVRLISKEADRFAKDSTKANSNLIDMNFKVKEIDSLAQSLEKMEIDTVGNIERITSIVAEQERLGADLDLASKIQIGMLPLKSQLLTEYSEFDVHATMKPAMEVGGDFYDFYMIDDTHLAIEIADVSDKGLGAAFYMAIAKTLFKSRARMGGSAVDIVTYVDKMISEKNPSGMFVTVWFAIIDLVTGHVDVCNAGHDYPAIMLGGQDFVIEKTPHGPPVAFIPGATFTGYSFEMEPGDRIFLYTDGLNESKRSDGERYGLDRMLSVLNSHKDSTNEELITTMMYSVSKFVGNEPQFDDMTMLGFTYKARKEKKYKVVKE